MNLRDLRVSYNSPVVLTYAILCSIIYFVDDFIGTDIRNMFMLSPYFQFGDVSHYPPLFLYTLVHASAEHLIGNLSFILLLGPVLEEKYGSIKLLIMMIFTAIITAILNLVFFNTGLLGASGIVFMFIMLISFANVRAGAIPLSFIIILILFVGKEFYKGIQTDEVSQFAHVIGGICGSIFGFMFVGKSEKDKKTKAIVTATESPIKGEFGLKDPLIDEKK